jgi:hypothetical protein
VQLSKYLVLVFILLSPSVVFSEDLGLMRLSLIRGNVQILTQDNEDWTPASINMPLNEGDRLWVAEDSRIELQVEGGVYVRADERTSLDILSVGGNAMQLYMDQGHLYINNRRGGIQTVQVDTPQSSIRSYDNSIMLLDIQEDSTTEVQTLKGYLHAENKEGKTTIGSGNALTIRPDGTAELAPIGTPDEWEKWNMDRDRQLVVWGESSRYLPDALHEYSSDFDQYGRWVYVSEYGYIWNPGMTAVDWVPYREGYWQWVRGRYVWISYEPWGWAPYHYGRWAYVTGTGWCWVPPAINEIYWGPGYVGWVNTPEYIGWVPLAPGEIYYGYGYYGPRSINITTVNVNTIVVQHYRNVPVRNSVTVVARDTFGTRERVLMRPVENPFVVHRDRFLPPASKPEPRTSMQQRMPEVKRPPDRIRQAAPAEIKVQRKLEREPEASVFRPGSPKQLPTRQLKEPKVVVRGKKSTDRTEPKEKREQSQKRER